ncbi:MAG: Ig-like domain repeat protein [Methanosphaera sp.]|nr:Ig-like domain repeat protein [Methanosphaera sp.]
MMKNTKIIFSIFFILIFFVSISSISATSVNDSQSVTGVNQLNNEINTEDSYQTGENTPYQTSSSTHVLNTTSFKDYVTDGKFNENVSEGDTIDIQGKLDDPKFALNINKPLNIISSTGDAYIDLNTLSVGTSGGYKNGMFQISEGSAGTNITGITFHNTRIWVANTYDVHINNISVICETSTGFGVGSFSIREKSHDITVTNSYFSTIHNGGHSNVVVAGASNCLFENNTVIANGSEGWVGNVFYLTTYQGGTNNNITIRNNTICSYNTDSMATCLGLVLEGSNHIIENNYIDANAAVRPQWADVDYGVVTNINNITFRNNYVRGGAQFVFTGNFYNNTIDSARFTDNKAYNNSIINVTINNNTVFENNTAKKVIVSGENNTLNNNIISSNEEYAVIVSGNNNTLSNNQLNTNNSIGDDTIQNSTEVTLINNYGNLPNKVYYINESNAEDFFDVRNMGYTVYTFKSGVFESGDKLILNFTPQDMPIMFIETGNIVNGIILETNNLNLIMQLSSSITVENSYFGGSAQARGWTFINSTVLNGGNNPQLDDDSYVLLEYPKDNIYVLTTYRQGVFDKEGNILNSVNDSATVLFYEFNTNYSAFFTRTNNVLYLNNLYLSKPLNFESIHQISNIESNIYFNEGSTGTNFIGAIFDGDLIFDTGYINFFNCTFNNDLIINNTGIHFDGCTFNGKITLNSSNNVVFNNCSFNSTDAINVVNTRNLVFENNTVTASAVNTIVFDDSYSDNVVRNNYLVAASLVGDDSVVTCDNIVEDNTPGYDTQIVIDCDSQAYVDDDFEVTITVNDLNNSKPVSKGYVEVYYDGYLIDIKDLTDGTTSVTIPIAEYIDDSNNYLKVWYYDGKRYNNNVTKKSISVVKSNVSIAVDEFNAKLNDKVEVTATFLNERGNPVGDTNVTFTVGRSSYTAQTDNGVATINELVTSEWLDAGKITVTFPNTDAYNANSTTITLNTSKADVLVTPVVSVDGNAADVELTLSDALGVNVTDGRVVLSTLDGQELASGRVSNGKFSSSVALPEGYSEEYLVANFTGSYYYNDFVRNVKISQMLNSSVTLETNSPLYGEELVITGRLVDSKNTPIGGANLTLNLNGSKVIVTTNDVGEYNYTYTPGLGVNSLTVTFDGTVDVYGSSASKDVTIRDTDREMNEVLNRLDELTSENAKLKEQLENLTHLSNDLKEQLANQTSELSEQNAALQQQINTLSTIISALTDIIDKQNEQIAALTAPENTTIVLNQVTDAKYKANVVISGMLNSQKGMALSGQTVTLTIGDKTVDVTTKNGEFEYTTVFKSVGEQTVTASYAGSDNYVASDASVTFDVAKQDVVVTVDPIADSAYGDNVTITGKFSDVDGKAISNSNVRVFVNGKKFLAKTDKTGIYTLSVKVNALGENNVTVGYAGNDNYNSYEDTTTFKADKQDVVVTGTVINIPKVGENVTITGTFTDKNGKAIINSNVKITINGKKYYARTDSTGTYTFTTTVTSAGMNNVTVGYSGNDKYNSYEYVTTFNVEAQDVIVTVNPIEEVAVGDNITITGTFTDKYGKVIINSNVKILFNGKKYYARTDSTGTYTFTTTVTTEGINNITVGYAGSAKYNAYETSTTFMAKAE